jgi:carboxyl-terminal processing protease
MHRRLGWVAALLCLLAGEVAAQDAKKAKSYLREVKRHLLESYIDREKLKDADLTAAALRGMAGAMDHKDFAALGAAGRAAVKKAVSGEETVDGALDAAVGAAPEIDAIKLADHAAQAMVRQTGDPFSRILTQEDFQKLLKMIQEGSREEHAGCALQLDGGKIKVMYVQFGTPAYEEGVEIGDEIVEIRGRTAVDLAPEEINDALRLPEGDTLELKVGRYGKRYDFKLVPTGGSKKVVRYEYLGQGIGYLRISMFDLSLAGDVKKALQELQKKGMKALILDLRHNPGGALPAATAVADLFLGQDLMITRTKSFYKPSIGGLKIPGFGGDMDFKTKAKSEFESMPMVCLVNRASASASELLAGALQDHKRAILIGETTYGKGVGQTPIFLNSMFMKRYLYLTVMRYTTPHGNEVDHKGVAPEIVSAEPRPTAEKFDALVKLRSGGELGKYLAAHWTPELQKAAVNDAFETSHYPEFADWYKRLYRASRELTEDEFREEIRRAARRKISVEGHVWTSDLQTDRTLQRGLVELLDRLGQ